jgi:hypothetical protein
MPWQAGIPHDFAAAGEARAMRKQGRNDRLLTFP